MTQTETQTGGFLIQYGYTIIASITIIALAAHSFILGGIPEISFFNQIIIQAAPFTFWLNAYYTLRRQAFNISERGQEWYFSIVMILFTILVVALGFYQTNLGYEYQYLLEATTVVGVGGAFALSCLSSIAIWFRIFRRVTWRMAVMALFLIIGLLTGSPLGALIHPFIPQLGDSVSRSIVSAGNAAFEVTASLGLGALIARVFIGRETLTPRGGGGEGRQ